MNTNNKILNIMMSNYEMVSIYKYVYILHSIVETSELGGNMVEMGCNSGKTSMVITLIDDTRKLYVYDSFNGLPAQDKEDGIQTHFVEGALKVEESELINNFKKYEVILPKITKAWFNQLTNNDIPSQISFAYLDGDFYNSTKTCLNLIYDKVVPRGIILIDDYHHHELPGVTVAVDEFIKHKNNHISEIPKRGGLYKITKTN